MANPASVYCHEQGYTLEIRTDADGEYGVCIFPDGSECEEWAYFRGECGPASEQGEAAAEQGEPAPEEATEEAIPGLPTAGLSNAGWTPASGELNGLPMVFVPAGCFKMGSPEAHVEQVAQECNALYEAAPFPCQTSLYQAEMPQHEVCIDEPFWIGQTEVTNAQYAACVEAGACAPPVDRTAYDDPANAEHPVIQVTWPDAMAYAQWIGGTLPSEAQWEYSARGPEGWIYPWGDNFEQDKLNYCDVNCDVYFWVDASYDDGYGYTAPVGTYPGGASWVGALDMSGNVWEWVGSVYRPYPYDAADGRDDPAAEGDHVLRGGAYDLSAIDLRPAFRYVLPPDGSCRGYGFRVAAEEGAVSPD